MLRAFLSRVVLLVTATGMFRWRRNVLRRHSPARNLFIAMTRNLHPCSRNQGNPHSVPLRRTVLQSGGCHVAFFKVRPDHNIVLCNPPTLLPHQQAARISSYFTLNMNQSCARLEFLEIANMATLPLVARRVTAPEIGLQCKDDAPQHKNK